MKHIGTKISGGDHKVNGVGTVMGPKRVAKWGQRKHGTGEERRRKYVGTAT